MRFSLDRAAAKALGPHPAFMDRSTPVSTYARGLPREDALISQRNALRHGEAYGGAQAIDWVYDCIGLYADPISTAPFLLQKPDGTKLYETKTKGTPPDWEQGPEDLYKLLNEPNPFMLYDELVSLLVIDLMLVGNAYWYKHATLASGKPLALYRLAPAYVKIVPSQYGPKRYEYQPPGVKDPMKLDPEQIIHFRRPNPHSPYYGMGVIQGGGRAMDLELAITDTISHYYENRADPSMIVQSERRVPRDVFAKLRAQLRARASGPHRAGDLLVLEAGLKAESLSTSAKDALFAELSEMSRDRVYKKFRAAPELFGESSNAAQGKVAEVRREFNNEALRPFMDRLQRLITARLIATWGVEFVIEHRQILPTEEALKVGESVASLPGVTVREVRRQYSQFGIEESTGDPEIDELVLNMPGEELDEDGQGGFADKPLGSEAGRPPLGENTRSLGSRAQTKRANGAKVRVKAGQKAGMAGMEYLQQVIAGELGAKAVISREEAEPRPNVLPTEKRPSDPFNAARTVDINSARDAMTADLRKAATELERGLLDHVEGKALKTSDLVGRVRGSEAWKTFRARLETILSEGTARAAQSGVMHSGLTPDDEIDYDDIAKVIVNRPEGLRGIVKTIRDAVVAHVRDVREKNGERHDYEAEIRSVLTDWAANKVPVIADSEATEAYNEGTLTAAEAAGVANVFVVEEEDAPDQACQDARHQVWSIDEARSRRKEHPNCRRAFLPLSAEAVA